MLSRSGLGPPLAKCKLKLGETQANQDVVANDSMKVGVTRQARFARFDPQNRSRCDQKFDESKGVQRGYARLTFSGGYVGGNAAPLAFSDTEIFSD